jgi:hypothetical protein
LTPDVDDVDTHLREAVLSRYTNECLSDSFPNSGHAFQDLVNEVGRRLGFSVTSGRYRGQSGQVGFDGLWLFPDRHAAVVEVKTTDTYRIYLETLANYRRSLIAAGTIAEETSSILIVVGREDTGDLEAQIRGSRFAWDMRVISMESLLRLLALKEEVEDPATVARIHAILVPHEFTRLDDIVELLFSTAEEVKQEDVLPEEAEDVAVPMWNLTQCKRSRSVDVSRSSHPSRFTRRASHVSKWLSPYLSYENHAPRFDRRIVPLQSFVRFQGSMTARAFTAIGLRSTRISALRFNRPRIHISRSGALGRPSAPYSVPYV